MSALDDRTVDPAKPHPSSNMGHEMSDFSWTTVLWLLPIAVVLLVVFTVVSLLWFRGIKTDQVNRLESKFSTEELKLHRLKEAEVLDGYKVLDKEKGRVRIPIARAMELVVQESQGQGRVDWKPITDTYLMGAAFARDAGRASEPRPTTGAVGEAIPPAGSAAKPAQKAEEKKAEETAPGGGAGTDPKKAH